MRNRADRCAGRGILNTDRNQLERVRRIAGGLIAQTRVFRPDASGWTWDINVQPLYLAARRPG
jgi:hypothetical protein